MIQDTFKKALLSGLFCASLLALFIFLKPIFAGEILVDPIVFSVGPMKIRWYGLLIGIALAFGFYLTGKRITNKFNEDLFEITAWWSVICGIICARLFYVAQNFNFYKTFPDDIFRVTEGGLSIHGAIFGGLVGTYFACNKDIKKILLFTDATVPALLIGMIIGRFGNFFNYEIFGYPTDLPWKMFVPELFRPGLFAHNSFFHPTFLYDAILNSILLIILLAKEKQFKLGELTLKFFIGISITRFIVELFRIGDKLFLGLTLAQVLNIIVLILVLVILKHRTRNI